MPTQMGSTSSCSRRVPTKDETSVEVVSKDDDDGDVTITEHAQERSVYFYPDAPPANTRDPCDCGDIIACCAGKKGRRVIRDVERLERDV